MGQGRSAEEMIAELERQLAARDKTIAALMHRVERDMSQSESAFSVFEQNKALECVVERKTRELQTNREELEQALAELKAAQSELLEARKLEAIGQLAAGVAHEINTPAQYVTDNAIFLRDSFVDVKQALTTVETIIEACSCASDDVRASIRREFERIDLDYLLEEVPKAVEQSLEGLHHIAKIVGAMKQFSHPGTGTKTPCKLDEIIDTSVTVSRNEWKYVCDLITEFDPELPAVPVLRSELSQVFLNLIVNAAHAIIAKTDNGAQGKGQIRITTRRVGEQAEIRIQDDGTGIPERIRNRVFEPFFTTKPVGKGTGQGLAIARSVVVDKHQGTIGLETEEGKGSTFIIRIPLVAALSE